VPFKGVAPAITDLIGGQLIVPTTAEAGAPQLPVESWKAVMAPASRPAAMAAKLSAEVLKIMATPDTNGRGSAQGFRVDARGLQASGKFSDDIILWRSRVIAAAKMTKEQGSPAGFASAGVGVCRADRASRRPSPAQRQLLQQHDALARDVDVAPLRQVLQQAVDHRFRRTQPIGDTRLRPAEAFEAQTVSRVRAPFNIEPRRAYQDP